MHISDHLRHYQLGLGMQLAQHNRLSIRLGVRFAPGSSNLTSTHAAIRVYRSSFICTQYAYELALLACSNTLTSTHAAIQGYRSSPGVPCIYATIIWGYTSSPRCTQYACALARSHSAATLPARAVPSGATGARPEFDACMPLSSGATGARPAALDMPRHSLCSRAAATSPALTVRSGATGACPDSHAYTLPSGASGALPERCASKPLLHES